MKIYEFNCTRAQAHSLVTAWKCHGKSIPAALPFAESIWEQPLNMMQICEIVRLLERTACLDKEGEPQDIPEDSIPDFWIIEALYNE